MAARVAKIQVNINVVSSHMFLIPHIQIITSNNSNGVLGISPTFSLKVSIKVPIKNMDNFTNRNEHSLTKKCVNCFI